MASNGMAHGEGWQPANDRVRSEIESAVARIGGKTLYWALLGAAGGLAVRTGDEVLLGDGIGYDDIASLAAFGLAGAILALLAIRYTREKVQVHADETRRSAIFGKP